MQTIKLPMRRLPIHRGAGVGGIFAKLARLVTPMVRSAAKAAKPIAKRTLKELGRQGLDTAASTLGDVIAGKGVKRSIQENVQRGAKRARTTVTRGAKQAAKKSIKSVRKDIKRTAQSGRGRRRKTQRGRGIFKR